MPSHLTLPLQRLAAVTFSLPPTANAHRAYDDVDTLQKVTQRMVLSRYNSTDITAIVNGSLAPAELSAPAPVTASSNGSEPLPDPKRVLDPMRQLQHPSDLVGQLQTFSKTALASIAHWSLTLPHMKYRFAANGSAGQNAVASMKVCGNTCWRVCLCLWCT